jgi:quercetin dioxygenase-like cupin family protein
MTLGDVAMKMHSCWNFVLNTLGVILIVVCICRAQSAQSSSVSLPAGGAKPLLLERNEGELRVRRAVTDAPSQSGNKPADPVPFILKVSPKNNGSEHLVLITEDLPPGGSIAKHKHLGQDEILLIQAGTVHAWLGDEERDLHAGGLVFIPTNTWIALKNTSTEPSSLVAIFSAPGFEDYLRCRSVPASEKGTSVSMEEIKGCAHEGHVTFEAFEKNPNN